MNVAIDNEKINAVRKSGLVIGINNSSQDIIAFFNPEKADGKLNTSAENTAASLDNVPDTASFFGSQSAENILHFDTTFGDLRSFLIEAQNSLNNNNNLKLTAAAAPFSVSEAGVYFIKLNIGDISSFIGRKFIYYILPYNSQQPENDKLNAADIINDASNGILIDENGDQILEYAGGEINIVAYIEQAGMPYGHFIMAANDDNDDEDDAVLDDYRTGGCNSGFNLFMLLVLLYLYFILKKAERKVKP